LFAPSQSGAQIILHERAQFNTHGVHNILQDIIHYNIFYV